MDDLIKDISERTGLSSDKVLEVVTMVTEYMRQALPDDLVEQVSGYLGVAASAAGDAAGTAKDATSGATSGASDMMNAATGVAASALNAAKDAISSVTSSNEQ